MIERFVLSTRDDLELFGRCFVSWLGGSLPPMTNCMVKRNNLDLIHNINLRFREMQPPVIASPSTVLLSRISY